MVSFPSHNTEVLINGISKRLHLQDGISRTLVLALPQRQLPSWTTPFAIER